MVTLADTLRRTNEQPGTRARLRNLGTSAYKVREVLNLIRGEDVRRAAEILRFCERGPAEPVQKLLRSAVANAEANDGMDPEELFVSACFADEGATMKRFRPRARGRAGRIRKRSSHVTIIVGRLPEDRLERLRSEREALEPARRRRVAGSRSERVARGRRGADTAAASEDAAAEEAVLEEAAVSEEVVTVESSDVSTSSGGEEAPPMAEIDAVESEETMNTEVVAAPPETSDTKTDADAAEEGK